MKTLQYANSIGSIDKADFKQMTENAVEEVNRELVQETDILKSAFLKVV